MPAWLVNIVSKQTPLHLLAALRRLAPMRAPSIVEDELATRADFRALLVAAP